MIDFDTFTKNAQEVGDFGKLIVAKSFKKLPKVQEIAQSGHIGDNVSMDFLAKILTHDGQLFNLANNENY